MQLRIHKIFTILIELGKENYDTTKYKTYLLYDLYEIDNIK